MFCVSRETDHSKATTVSCLAILLLAASCILHPLHKSFDDVESALPDQAPTPVATLMPG